MSQMMWWLGHSPCPFGVQTLSACGLPWSNRTFFRISKWSASKADCSTHAATRDDVPSALQGFLSRLSYRHRAYVAMSLLPSAGPPPERQLYEYRLQFGVSSIKSLQLARRNPILRALDSAVLFQRLLSVSGLEMFDSLNT
jgi:hypothetical protein